MSTSPVKSFLVNHFMPEKCYAELLVNFNLHVPCLTLVLNKIIGLWLVLDVVFAQLLQLLKILWGRNAEGVNSVSILLQLYASSGPVLFAMTHNFPLLAWGERLFLTIQTTIILFLILHYRGDTWRGILFVLAYGGLIVLMGSYAPAQVISAMQSSGLAGIIASKILQAGTNYRNGHTGQLSSASVLLSCAASLGLIFVSLQDTGKSLATASYLMSACFSCILLAQVLCYGNNKISMLSCY
ncbi:mannose-P-dolichol utilization defect 1 protein-like isoform X1 [Hippocampus zosterae]|uniref:mannose-P-dolichol utilization defect 1 protein-like isoform X1 n=1 Tax=Hippocampus zosterae TaxID=109293 RepID=UPI00223DAF39|nr:mannose-P-dolichol utilization defect 1 protein-like isoform X1 [Hippocampus zosterae]